jgi:SAM-dependent methyltransferase
VTVSAEDVRNGYRFILGRLPENELVVQIHRDCADVAHLRNALLSSREFRDQGFFAPPKAFLGMSPPEDVETVTDEATLKAIVAKTGEYWSAAGKTEPHFSVLTEDRFAPEHIAENQAEFYASGLADRDLVVALLRRIGRSADSFQCCVEYGCGVGRDTLPLAAIFRRMIALDISLPHLDIARKESAARGVSNVSFMQVTPDNIMPATGYDVWYSRLVLQHNPPPVTVAVLEKAFAGLAKGGVAIVHLPTYCEGYSFRVADYLSGNIGQAIEMHATPQRAILDVAARHACCLREIHEEPGHRIYITNIFVFEKSE